MDPIAPIAASKPFYRSKKFWTYIIGVLSVALTYQFSPAIADHVTALAVALITGFGLADMGKEAKAIQSPLPLPLMIGEPILLPGTVEETEASPLDLPGNDNA